ncbi:hypothetical protein, partial [Salmonella sp. s51228]|uniref:hypothetical protein n=1 Tax=Salmonella sp. s51228 TaxID=3159652 RepID=UPI00397EB474
LEPEPEPEHEPEPEPEPEPEQLQERENLLPTDNNVGPRQPFRTAATTTSPATATATVTAAAATTTNNNTVVIPPTSPHDIDNYDDDASEDYIATTEFTPNNTSAIPDTTYSINSIMNSSNNQFVTNTTNQRENVPIIHQQQCEPLDIAQFSKQHQTEVT